MTLQHTPPEAAADTGVGAAALQAGVGTTRRDAPPGIADPVRMAVAGSIVERRDTEEVVSIIETRLTAEHGAPLSVGSVNLDHLHHFRSPGPATASGLQWLLLADGMPIAWRGRVLTAQPWPRVTGADLLPKVLELAATTGARVGFFGGSAATHELLATALADRYPTLSVAGMWSPDGDAIDRHSGMLAATIAAAGPDILVVSLGKPRQERWVDAFGEATGARVFLPFGGAADFLAGRTRRAPAWMRRHGLEWLHRLAREPRRLTRRYLVQGPISLLRAGRAQLICYPGVYYTGEPSQSGPPPHATRSTRPPAHLTAHRDQRRPR